jgi:DNA-directed RNA polymerase subunit RPC12/RpoP
LCTLVVDMKRELEIVCTDCGYERELEIVCMAVDMKRELEIVCTDCGYETRIRNCVH